MIQYRRKSEESTERRGRREEPWSGLTIKNREQGTV